MTNRKDLDNYVSEGGAQEWTLERLSDLANRILSLEPEKQEMVLRFMDILVFARKNGIDLKDLPIDFDNPD